MPVPDDRCERCTEPIAAQGGEVWRAWGDRICGPCARVAESGEEPVARVECPICLDLPLSPTDGPDGHLVERSCGACTPLPPSVPIELDDG